MKFWIRFWREENYWLAYSPDFDGLTQGDSLEDAQAMAVDWLVNYLEDTWAEGKELPAQKVDPETSVLPPEQEGTPAGQWLEVEIPLKAMTALTIKRERIKQGKTLRSAAAALNVALGTYQRWEDPRKFNATLETLEKVANSLGKKLNLALGDLPREVATCQSSHPWP